MMAEGILDPVQQLEAEFDFEIYTKREVDALLDEKADKADTYTKTEVDGLLDGKADADAVYTKTETDTLLNGKADVATTLAGYGIEDAYTKTEVDNALALKADSADVYTKTEADNKYAEKATTLAGYGITDAYTITETDNALALKAPLASPALSGTPTAPTASAGTNTTQIATTQFVTSAVKVPADRLEKLISILDGQIYDYETDSNPAYVKSVPAGAVEHANLDMLGGKTVVWNQLLEPTTSITNNGVTGLTISVSDGWITVSGTAETGGTLVVNPSVASVPANHKMFLQRDGGNFEWGRNGFSYQTADAFIHSHTVAFGCTPRIKIIQGETYNFTTRFNVIDMTLLFGAGNEPTTVSEFQAMFPASYYSYNAGALLSADVTQVVSKDAEDTTIDTYTIPAEIQALEGYGWSAGSAYNYIDFERKVFVKNVGRVDLGSSSWTYQSAYTRFYTNGISTLVKAPSSNSEVLNGVTDVYIVGAIVGSSAIRLACSTAGTLYLFDNNYTDEGTLETALSGHYLYYELKTPVETDISAYLTDDTISVESGGTLTFPNSNGDDYRISVPNTETYMIDLEYALDH